MNDTLITPERLELMIREVIEAGKSSNLIASGYLEMMSDVAAQVYKRHARQKLRAAIAARKALQ
jgi:hypothetical protein